MTTARTAVLGRVRDALALAPTPDTTIPRDYRTGRTLPDDERLALFTDRLVDYKAQVHTCTATRTAEVIAQVLDGLGARRIGVPAGLDEQWLGVYDGDVQQDSAGIPAPRLDALDGVVTASAVGCAETGTIFLDGSPDQGRRALSLVPDLHVCGRSVGRRGGGAGGGRAIGAGAPDDADQRTVGHVGHRAGAGRRGTRSAYAGGRDPRRRVGASAGRPGGRPADRTVSGARPSAVRSRYGSSTRRRPSRPRAVDLADRQVVARAARLRSAVAAAAGAERACQRQGGDRGEHGSTALSTRHGCLPRLLIQETGNPDRLIGTGQ